MKRRNFLKLAGGGVIVAAGSAALFATTRTPETALAPWRMAGSYDDPRMNALSHAILAPNPHNRQPWVVRLDADDGLTLFFDTDKQLPHTDPFDRQLTIGLGCFLELMRMTAKADGFDTNVTLFPEGESGAGLDRRPVAQVTFTGAAAEIDPLAAHIPNRRSNKEPYDTTRSVPPETLGRILAVARQTRLGGSIASEDIAYWRAHTIKALMVEIETPRTYKESVDLMRIGKAEINANPDGIDLGGAFFDGLNKARIMTRKTILDPDTMVYSGGVDAVVENAQTAMGHLWMITQSNTRRDQIAAGADWLRINLACTAEGIAFHPLSQPLQEYPEMSALLEETHQRLAPDGGTVQMLARVGYGPDVPVSPRWPVEAKVAMA